MSVQAILAPACRAAAPLLVLAAAVVPFLPALNNAFVTWDDDQVFLLNPRIRALSWDNVRWMFTTNGMGHYQPLTWLSIALDCRLGGLNPRVFHRTNLLLHGLTATLFYFVCLRLLRAGFADPTGRRAALRLGAAVAALFFAVHPLRVESVAWATERRDVLCGVFFAATILFHLRAADSATRRPRAAYALGVVCMALSLLAKAWGIALPVILIAIDVVPLRRIQNAEGRWDSRAVRRALREKLPHVFLALGGAVAALWAQGAHKMGVISLERHGLSARLAQAAYGIAFYPLRTLWPRDLAPLYEIPRTINLLSGAYVLAAAFAIVATVAAWRFRHRYPAWAAVWVCYLATVFPVLGVAQSGPQFVADRYSYLSCLGFALLAGAGVYAVARRGAILAVMTTIATAIALGLLGRQTWQQTLVWRNTESLWTRVLAVSPDSSLAHDNFGTYWLIERRDPDRAETHLRRAVALRPDNGHAWHNLGHCLAQRDRLDEALDAYRRGLSISPDPLRTRFDIGALLARRGEYAEAVQWFEQCVAGGFRVSESRRNLGYLYRTLGRTPDAVRQYRALLALNPDDRAAQEGLNRTLQVRPP